MRVIPPLEITAARLTSSTAPEPGVGEVAYSASTPYVIGQQVIIGAPTSTVTITIASPGVFTWVGHGQPIWTPIVFTTSGTLPTGIVSGTVYYMKTILTDTFEVSATIGGASVVTTGSQSGTHTATTYIHRKYEALQGASTTVTMTIASPCVVTWANHNLIAGTSITFTTTGALPTGLVVGTVYYVLAPTSTTFNLAAISGGTAINTSGSQSGTHTGYAPANINYYPLSTAAADWWLDVGPTNKYAMFDLDVNTATEVASPLTVVITPGIRLDSAFLGGLAADAISITTTNYSYSASLVTRETTGWYDYFYKPFTLLPSVALFDIPPISANVITVTLTRTGANVKCGALVLGTNQFIGDIEYSAQSESVNYSTVTRDSQGVATIVKRRSIPRANLTLWVDKSKINVIRDLRSALNGEVAAWVGLDDTTSDFFEAVTVLGYYDTFGINLEHPTRAKINLDLTEL